MESSGAAPAVPMSRVTSARGSAASSASVSQATSTFAAGMLSPSGDPGFGVNGVVAVMRMLKLVVKDSGLCLFTAQWKWNVHGHAEGADVLIQSLSQFAREIDGGDIVRVHFDSRATSSSIGNGNAGTSSSTGSLTPTHAKTAPEEERRLSSVSEPIGPLSLEMLSHHNGPIQGVLFHDRVSEVTTQRLRVFVELVVERFLQLYHHEIDRLQPTTPADQAALTPDETARLVAPFASFDKVFQNELVTTL